MPTVKLRPEIVAHDSSGWHYHFAVPHGEGQARLTLDFDHEPTQGELEAGVRKWAKELRPAKPITVDVDVEGE